MNKESQVNQILINYKTQFTELHIDKKLDCLKENTRFLASNDTSRQLLNKSDSFASSIQSHGKFAETNSLLNPSKAYIVNL